jgi:hypothetical protein
MEPTTNRGDKDPDNLISNRIKHYGTTFSVYDIDTAEEGTYQITVNGMINKTIEIKRASIDSNGIVHLPYARPGQLQYLHNNWYGSFIAYCIVYKTDAKDNKKIIEDNLFYYLVSPCNFRGAVEEEMLTLQYMTEEQFQYFFSATGSSEGTKELSIKDIKKDIKGYRYYTTDGKYNDYSKPEYFTVERVLEVANKNKNKQPCIKSWTEKIEAKVKNNFYKRYLSLQEAVLGSTS